MSRVLRSADRKRDKMGAAALERLLSPKHFRRELARERARSDRSGDVFSLVVFSGPAASPDACQRLAVVLGQRLRETDAWGWLNESSLAAILPDTPAEGAWKVADDVMAAFDPSPFEPVVYVHPIDRDPTAGANGSDGREGREGRAARGRHRPVHDLNLLFARPMPRWKRSIDVLASALALALLSPLLLLVAALIKLASPGPVFFRQWRAGLAGKPFLICKFRSMTVDAEAQRNLLASCNEQDGPAFKIRNDPRVTWIGRLLRKTSVDELPQLWNVLRGEMSLVGPRPLPVHEAAACSPWHRRRLDVTPGMTCFWQVRGRSRVTFVEWMRMDLQYVRNRSWRTDLFLLLATVPAVLRGRGAS